VIKEEHQTETSPVQFRSVMFRDSTLWWDGWFWAVIGVEAASSASPSLGAGSGCAEAQFPGNGPALTCWNCHSSAVADFKGTGTYSSTAFIKSKHKTSSSAVPSTPDDAVHGAIAAHRGVTAHSQVPPDPDLSGFTGQLPSSIFDNARMLPAAEIPCMVPESQDLVFSKPAAAGGPSLLVTSPRCAGCHEANALVTFPANMLLAPTGPTPVNLSQRGEWRYSMMGLSGRDPIFFAQLDTESTVHNNIKGKSNPPAFIQDTCLSCHGV